MHDFNTVDDEEEDLEFEDDRLENEHYPFDDGTALSFNETVINKRGLTTVPMDEYHDSYLPLIKSVDDGAPSIYSDPSLLNTILEFGCYPLIIDHWITLNHSLFT